MGRYNEYQLSGSVMRLDVDGSSGLRGQVRSLGLRVDSNQTLNLYSSNEPGEL